MDIKEEKLKKTRKTKTTVDSVKPKAVKKRIPKAPVAEKTRKADSPVKKIIKDKLPVRRVRKKIEKIKQPPVEAIVNQEIEKTALPIETVDTQVVDIPVIIEPEAEKLEPKKTDTVQQEEPVVESNELELDFPISVKELSIKLQVKPSRLIQELLRMGVLATINQSLFQDNTIKICEKFGLKAKAAPDKEEKILAVHRHELAPEFLKTRSPVVTFMGHVDHGKTSLLDIIRKTNVVDVEHGGITQHIGAYEVSFAKGKITFLDTPGHEAFTAMRSHGAHITDIVVLVVAADDGVMPQTIEAIDHARAANVPIIVAINKIDRSQSNIDRVKKQLSELDLRPEDWQGKTITVGVSAKTGQGVDDLLDMIILEAEMLELKANYDKPASGVVIESRHDKNRGSLTTLLVENGTLRLNDYFVCGLAYAKVKAMFNCHGQKIEEVFPGSPVEVLGVTGVSEAGEEFFVVSDEKQAREMITLRTEKQREQGAQPVKRISLEELHTEIKQGKIKELKVIIKADVSGSLEAVRDSLLKLETSEVKFQIVHTGVGAINSSDAILAKVTNAFILGFHVQPDERAKEIIDKEDIEVRTYNIIYELIREIKDALEGLLEPKIKKIFLGRAEIRKVFKVSRAGVIAGSFVSKGKILRSNIVNLIRNGQVVFEGKISNLKRFKDDVREVSEGYECGISLSGFDDFQTGDLIEAYDIQKIARKL